MIKIASRLEVPTSTKAILWDMDGVIIDSLGLDVEIVNDLIKKYFGEQIVLTRDYIRVHFAYDIPKFWRIILKEIEKKYKITGTERFYQQIFEEYNTARQQYKFFLNPGILEILEDVKNRGFKIAVVSNNPTRDVEEILENIGVKNSFDLIIGNDLKKLKKKPAPDTYLFAVKELRVDPKACVVIEDSDIGIQAGKAAGCFTVGVATGSLSYEQLLELKEKGMVDQIYKILE